MPAFDPDAPGAYEPLLGCFYTEDGLARELDVTKATLRRWRSLGDSPPVTRLGRRVLFSRDGVRAWLNAREIDTAVTSAE